jgi:hypothetical protein
LNEKSVEFENEKHDYKSKLAQEKKRTMNAQENLNKIKEDYEKKI